jgi:hypothetical protein
MFLDPRAFPGVLLWIVGLAVAILGWIVLWR